MCGNCEWEELLEQIDELLENEDCEFAAITLEGIKEWVATHEHCTEKQKTAVANIAETVNR